MQEMMGIIANIKNEELMPELTQHRCLSAVPFGGRYRVIDFVLSSMVNSGIRNVAVISSHKYRSLVGHLGSGKEWGLDRKSEGLMVLPSASPGLARRNLSLDLKDMYANIDYLEKSRQQYVVISGNNVICNLNYQDVLVYHKQKNAHITMIYKQEKGSAADLSGVVFLGVGDDGRVNGIYRTPYKLGHNNVSMEMMIMRREFLKELIWAALASGNWDLTAVIAGNLDDIEVFAFPFKGYLARINSVESYFRHNMELLNPEISQELFFGHGPIYTKTKDGPPTRYSEGCSVTNSLVASGCIVEGSVENSVLFRGVDIGRGALVKNSIIMQKSAVEENAVLENVILDKEVVIRKGTVLKGQEGQPIVIGKNNML
ncbi:MAG: glucose-1-phosphate adenylyltransferase subunit GlgD [Peptococcaceae bacterium]|jgi:glucose-1-phosphate adenylyltransferase|nr:glucose-1-phosphate adenylyltransferase subunit GlgD [Peptococcaceae bacterium]MDH7525673.1 glucose-1-phosphate adenylyltransferase subunit GlgD [Peptococcaceae bacterium]